MTTYTITNSAGNTVTTIGVASTTGTTYPIELIGQGVSLYGQKIATTQYHMLENFASSTAPTNPVTGMTWYNPSIDSFTYYDGSNFIPLGGSNGSGSALFTRLSTASAIDLSATASHALFTDPNTGGSYHVTGLLLKPTVATTVTATTPAIVDLSVSASEDVMESVAVTLTSNDTHGYYIVQGTTRHVQNGESLMLNVTNPVASGVLSVDAYVFGFRTTG